MAQGTPRFEVTLKDSPEVRESARLHPAAWTPEVLEEEARLETEGYVEYMEASARLSEEWGRDELRRQAAKVRELEARIEALEAAAAGE